MTTFIFPSFISIGSIIKPRSPFLFRTQCRAFGTGFDLVSLPGRMPGAVALKDRGILESVVKKHVADGQLYAGNYAAPAMALGSWGLMKSLKATCYPSFMEQLSSTALQLNQESNRI